jgi:hypothetical protein
MSIISHSRKQRPILCRSFVVPLFLYVYRGNVYNVVIPVCPESFRWLLSRTIHIVIINPVLIAPIIWRIDFYIWYNAIKIIRGGTAYELERIY